MTPSFNLVADDLALVIDFHGAGERQPVNLRAQAAEVGRKFERQHRDGAVGKIDAGAAQARFLVERRVGRDVVGDVGDMHLQFIVVVFELANVDSIVEVAGGLAVDGDDGKLAVVAAVAQFMHGNDVVVLDGLRFFAHLGRKAVRQVKLADHDFDVDAEIAFCAQDLDDAAAWILRGARPVGDLDVDHNTVEILRARCGGRPVRRTHDPSPFLIFPICLARRSRRPRR